MSASSLLGKPVEKTEGPIKRATLDEIRAMKERGELWPTCPDAPEGPELGEDFWANAVLVEPAGRKSVHLRLDPTVYDFFFAETGGKGHIRKMQQVLKAYVDARSKV